MASANGEDLSLRPKPPNYSLGTIGIHADDSINVNADVAPPLHVSTTFRYSDNPEKLIPASDDEVCLQSHYMFHVRVWHQDIAD